MRDNINGDDHWAFIDDALVGPDATSKEAALSLMSHLSEDEQSEMWAWLESEIMHRYADSILLHAAKRAAA